MMIEHESKKHRRRPCSPFMPLGVSAIMMMLSAAALRAETVLYDVTFDATWAAQTHPYDFPSNPHFSGLVGGTHNGSVRFWQPGGIASQGIENMAELGSQSTLSSEVAAAIQAGNAHSVIRGGGIGVSPASVSTQFELTDDFPLVTLVSMIAPSPDWFVGVADLDLRRDSGWLGRIEIDLWPYDAGTDDGGTFTSPDDDTNPQVPISHLSRFPFAGTPPLGTFTFVRKLAGDYNKSGTWDTQDIDALSLAVRSGSGDTRFDLDGNGMVNAEDRSYWIVDLKGSYFGDANLDGRFDSLDLVTVFQAGQYEDTVTANSIWISGDWNGNAEFDSSDLVLAFQAGGYDAGVRSASIVPEPSGLYRIAVLFALGSLIALRRKPLPLQ